MAEGSRSTPPVSESGGKKSKRGALEVTDTFLKTFEYHE